MCLSTVTVMSTGVPFGMSRGHTLFDDANYSWMETCLSFPTWVTRQRPLRHIQCTQLQWEQQSKCVQSSAAHCCWLHLWFGMQNKLYLTVSCTFHCGSIKWLSVMVSTLSSHTGETCYAPVTLNRSIICIHVCPLYLDTGIYMAFSIDIALAFIIVKIVVINGLQLKSTGLKALTNMHLDSRGEGADTPW